MLCNEDQKKGIFSWKEITLITESGFYRYACISCPMLKGIISNNFQ